MKKLVIATACALLAPFAFAQSAGDIVVRVRAVDLQSANGNSADLQATLTAVAKAPATASINDKWLPEIDFTYYFTPNIAAELVLTVPQTQTLSVSGVGPVGTFKHLPPTLSAQYHFTGLPGGFKPYLGLGLNYTNISATDWNATGQSLGLNLKRNSVGLSLQAGVDYAIDNKWSLNLDIKKVQIGTDVLSNGTKIGTFKVDPLLVGLGVGYKF